MPSRLTNPLLLLLVAACAAGGCAATAPAASDATPGSFTIATGSEPVCWDPHVDPSSKTASIQRNVFDSLVATDAGGGIRPWLAESWQVSPDQLSYTFVLRRDVVFHDGTPLTAQAVRANLDHIADPRTKSQNASELLGPYAGTDIVDEHTARVRFQRPHASFLNAASTTGLGLYSPRALAAAADDLCAGGPRSVGSGPFRFTEVIRGQRAEFARVDGYRWWPAGAASGPARLGTVVYRFATDNQLRVGLLQSGQVDAIDTVPPSSAAAVTAGGRVWARSQPKPGAAFSMYLNTERAPFDERAARDAVRSAIDVDAVVRTVFFGEQQRAWSALSPTVRYHDPTRRGAWRYDPARADRLLDELGYRGRDADGYRVRDGRTLTLAWPYIKESGIGADEAVTIAVQQYLRRVGIRVLIEPMDLGSYITRRNAGDYDVISFSWNVADPSVLAAVFASGSQFTDGGVNGSRVHDADLDELLARGASVLDPATREASYVRVQQLVSERVYSVPLYLENNSVAASTRVQDLDYDANGALPLRVTRVEDGS